MKTSKSNRKILVITFIALLLDLLAFTAILPLFPRILEYYVETQKEDGLFGVLMKIVHRAKNSIGGTKSDLEIVLFGGLLGSIFSFLQFVSSPFIGVASDKWGRRPVLLICTIGTIISHTLWFFADDFGLFVLSRMIGGMSKGIVQISTSIVADVTTPESRTQGMAMIGIAFSIGFTLGPALGAYLSTMESHWVSSALKSSASTYTFSNAAFFSLALSFLDLIFIFVFLKETLHFSQDNTTSSKEEGNKKEEVTLNDTQRASVLQDIHLTHLIYLLIFSGVEFTLTFLTYDRFNYSNVQNGRMLGFIGIFSAIIQGGFLRRSGHKIGEHKVALYGMISLVIGIAVLSLCNSFWSLYSGVIFFSFASSVVVSCLTSLTSFYAKYDLKGTELGKLRSYGQLGRALGPLFVSFLYWTEGSTTSYLVTACFMILPLLQLRKVVNFVKEHSPSLQKNY